MDIHDKKTAYRKLPESLREAIVSPERFEITDDIVARYSLNEETAKNIEKEIGLTLFFIENVASFKDRLLNAQMPKEAAEQISNEIHEKIFTPILSELEKINAEKATGPEYKTFPEADKSSQDIAFSIRRDETVSPNTTDEHTSVKEDILKELESPPPFSSPSFQKSASVQDTTPKEPQTTFEKKIEESYQTTQLFGANPNNALSELPLPPAPQEKHRASNDPYREPL